MSQEPDDDSEYEFLNVVSTASDANAPELSLAYIKYISFDSVQNAVALKINAFPLEILTAILVLIPDRFNERPEKWKTSCRRLAQVCKMWKGAIEGTMCFRSTFCFQPSTRVSHIHSFDNRTSSVPVSLAFYFLDDIEDWDGMEEWLEECVVALSGCIARCRFVLFKVRDAALSRLLLDLLHTVQAVQLRCAVVDMATNGWLPQDQQGQPIHPIFGGQMPIIEDLTVVGDLTQWTTPIVYSSLTSLTLAYLYNTFGISTHDFFLLLRQSPMLQRIRLDWLTFYDYDIETSDPPVMHHLTHLSLAMHAESALQAVGKLVMPALVDLHFEATSDAAALGILKEFTKLGQHVEKLAIRSGKLAADTLLEIDRLMPNSDPLSTRGCTDSFCCILHAIAIHWPVVLPRLREVTIDENVGTMHEYAQDKLDGIADSPAVDVPRSSTSSYSRDIAHRYKLVIPMASCLNTEDRPPRFHSSECFLAGR
ncbi:hypothetical protein R3P38DRAFT_2770255 [Favolaschia claudopus]|uniref:F-box domain-containing protein n=1 Tax=Favolaschia claudopus TaxID=2862362 RepID=A0AAW0CIM6_9AGAR